MREFLYEGFPNPGRKGCPDEDTLKLLARDPFSVNESVRTHIGSCSECFSEYQHHRQDWLESKSALPSIGEPSTSTSPPIVPMPSKRWPSAIPWALAASLLIGSVGFFLVEHRQAAHSLQSSLAPVSATVDLLNSGTVRGPAGEDAAPLKEVSLPATIVHLSVILPRFSEAGRYDVLVSKDKAGSDVIAMGAGKTQENGGKTAIDVTLDLRSAAPGAYFLGTVRGSDHGAYYYPLEVH